MTRGDTPATRIGPLTAVAMVTCVVIAVVVVARFATPARSGEVTVPPAATVAAPASEPATTDEDPDSERRERFPPSDLVLLEGQDRADWQKPDQIMDELHIADGSKVADVGAGSGWFTIRLARAVGPGGVVYAQDLQSEMITAISRRVKGENLTNVHVVQGREDSPNLPTGVLDAVLVVDVYPEVASTNRETFLRQLASALKPRGRLGIVNYKPGGGGPGPEAHSRVESAEVEQDARAAGLDVVSLTDLGFQYLIVLRPRPGETSGPQAAAAAR